jgi:hypothetical protein
MHSFLRFVGFGVNIKSILGFAIVVLALSHVLIVGSMIGENSDTSAIVFATNNDASVAITVSTQTQWFNDNLWRPYGPLYYRLAHSLVKLVPQYKTLNVVPQEENEVRHHFALMLVSFLSLLLTCFVLAGLFRLSWVERIGLTSLFLSLFLLNRVFSKYVLIVHPDFLLTLLTSLLFLTAHQFLRDPKQTSLFLLSGAFGLMLSTKMTAILFLPGLFWVLLHPRGWKRTLINFFWFSLGTAFTYFAVGYPQNFRIHETLSFLAAQSAHSAVGNGASLVEWIQLFTDQFWMPVALVLFLCLFVRRSTISNKFSGKRWDRSSRVKLVLFGVSPMLMLLSRQFNSPHEYYTIPFGILFLMVLIVLGGEKLNFGFLSKFPGLRKMILLLAIPFFAVRSNTYFASLVKEETANQANYREIQAWIAEKAKQGEAVLLTSYVPLPYDSTGIVVDNVNTFEKLKGINYSAMALNKTMYSRYLVGDQPSEYVLVDFKTRDWKPVREFYNYFREGEDVKTPDGKEWRMVGDRCDIQLWQVKP